MANDRDFPGHWVDKNIVKYKDMITSIAVGNEWLHEGHYPELLVPAMKHLHKASEILERDELFPHDEHLPVLIVR